MGLRRLILKSPPRFRMVLPLLLLLILLLCESSLAKTVRYRPGVLDGDFLEERQQVTVADARELCRHNPSCVSFSFASPTRFPDGNVTCYFWPFSDWHVKRSGEPSFVHDPNWHSYMNTTRERALFPKEINLVMEQLHQEQSTTNAGKNLRQSGEVANKERKLLLILSLFEICRPQEYRVLAAPVIAPFAIKTAVSSEEDEEVRLAALRLLILVGDSTETGKLLFDAGLYAAMKTIIDDREENTKEWAELPKMALDALSNVCLHRSANTQLVNAGASKFLGSLLSEPGFAALQALLALTHLGVGKRENGITELDELPQSKLNALVALTRNAIDGDVTFDIIWDLVPGPLSAINHLILHSHRGNPLVVDMFLDAGVMEQLLRVLESDCLVSSDVEEALDVMFLLAQVSERARRMVLLAEHQIHETEMRLRKYSKSIQLANQLNAVVTAMDSARSEL